MADHSSSERDVARFDRWASSYDRGPAQTFFFRPVYRGVVELARGAAPATARILDAGCGTGALLRAIALYFPQAELVGADPSPEMIRVAAEANPAPERLQFVQAQAEKLPFPDGRFDLAVSTMSFHHWADQNQGLREIARVLAPGGRFLLADHFVTPFQWPFFVGRRSQDRFHTPGEIDEMLARAGFSATQWRDAYAIGPFHLVTAVLAHLP